MYVAFQKSGNHEYGYVATCFRDEESGKPRNTYVKKLGRVIDREKNIFYSKEKGLFKYDLVNDQYLPAPEGYSKPVRKPRLKVASSIRSLIFGDSWFLNDRFEKSGLKNIIRNCFADKADSICSLMFYYLLVELSNSHAQTWLDHNYAKLLFPSADLSSQRISELLEYIGEEGRLQGFFEEYFRWFISRCQNGKLDHILIDSTGMPNSIHFHLTAVSNHNGQISEEVRLIYVVQQKTGLPIYLRYIPGNVIDVTTIKRTIAEMHNLGMDTKFAIMDAGYSSEENIDAFYDQAISFLLRLQPNRKLYKKIVSENLADIAKNGTLIKQNGRLLIVQRVACQLNEKIDSKGKIIEKGHAAYAYLCVDRERQALEELKLIEKVKTDKLAVDRYVQEVEKKGIFVLVSKRRISPDKVIETYYTRQQIEQVFDLCKNYAKLLPLSVQKESTLRGHLMMTFVATILLKLIQAELPNGTESIKALLREFGYLSCKLYDKELVTSELSKNTRFVCEKLG